jgi:hypothetical protein
MALLKERDHMIRRQISEKMRLLKSSFTRRTRIIALLWAFLVIVPSCGGGNAAIPLRTAEETPISNPVVPKVRKGHVHISISEVGEDIEVTGKVVLPHLKKAFANANIKLVASREEAELILHGTVRLQLQQTDSRLGLDHHKYGAQADWQLFTGNGYRSLLNRETTTEGTGTGKVEAITNTLAGLADKVAAEAVPFIKGELAKR